MGKNKETFSEDRDTETSGSKTAKKDFVIHHNEVHIEIKQGDRIPKSAEPFLTNLKTEGVI